MSNDVANSTPKRRRLLRAIAWSLLLLIVGTTLGLSLYEMQTSRLQARVFSELAHNATFTVERGMNPLLSYPRFGPYDERLGYTRLPSFIDSLTDKGYRVTAQARTSEAFRELRSLGIFPVYDEKVRAGLTILDRDGDLLYGSLVPERTYKNFDQIPQIIVDTLLFIENRELLDAERPYRNPAVEWDRLFRSVGEMALNLFIDDEQRVAGGSTLATQIEKYRHSPEGRTTSGREKLRQMVSASLRAYQQGEDTLAVRKRIVLDYVNSVPLAAAAGFGEVNGLGDGLWAWYGSGFAGINTLLRAKYPSGSELEMAQALAYKQVLSLFIAQRRPAYYLSGNFGPLEELTNIHLQLLESRGVISHTLRHNAEKIPLRGGHSDFALPDTDFLAHKAANTVRTRLLTLLDTSSLYELDRLDLTVDSTLDSAAQSAVTAVLKALQDPNVARNNGLYGFRLLQEKDDLSRIVFSFTLVERGRSANLVRIQTDNYDQPFNINEGVKLDLGSTAKLRTLVTYLDVIATLYERYAGAPRKELAKVTIGPNDALSRWAVDFLLVNPQASLSDMLEAAMERQYSANPSERFFTGGGIHTFANFDSLDNNKIMTVRHALHNSVNLVFVRLMRDIVHYYMYQTAGPTAQLLAGDEDARRGEYLAKFADREGSQFVQNFYRKFAHKTQNEILELLMGRGDTKPRRMATIYRSVLPQAGLAEFGGYLLSQLTESPIRNEEITQLYAQNDPAKLSLPDRGFLSRVHPLELWVAQYLIAQPNASLKQTLDASAEDRQAVYQWLFKTRNKKAQDLRIRYLLEVEAFLEIHRQWKRMGYPFDYLVPSYASALGSSGDRPAALAELMGIIANAGVYYPTLRVTGLHFAAQTPYETRLEWSPRPGEQVLAPEVTATLKRALQGVVQLGTARRLNNVFTDAQGNPIAVGGKTGTGDHRRESYGAGGRVIKSEVVNRTATFAFFIGEDHFGTLTAYVPGAAAANYRFTSGLPVQLLKAIAPVLTPMLRAATTTSYSATVPTSGSSIVSGSSGSPRKSSSGTSSSGNSSAGTSSSKPPSSAASSSIIDSSSAGMSSAEPLEESTSGNISPPDPSSDDDMTSSDVPSAEDATATPP